MKAKYCPCLGVKFGAAGRRDIAEDFGLMGLELAGTMKVYYGLKGVKSKLIELFERVVADLP
jgi:hypothetical protein